MKTMKAYVRTNSDNQEVKQLDVPIPQVNSDEVLIKVKAFGVGIHDRYFIPSDALFPYVIGSEGSGVIEKLGADVLGYKMGDKVIFSTVLQPQGGSWAEYGISKYKSLIPLPDKMTFAQGATVPVAGKTALECMRSLKLEKGDSLFIAGASGAIGTLVIQLAAKKGIRVATSASQKNHEYMTSLGAVKTVDYHEPNWKKEIKAWSNGGVDGALAIQPGTGEGSIQVVKDGGRLVTVSGDNMSVIPERYIDVQQMGHHDDMDQKMHQFISDVSEGNIKIVIEKEYSFSEALDALEKTETRHARGKSVVILDNYKA